jgi:hypothetical protein
MESFPRAAPSKRDKEIKVMTALITMSLLSLLFLGPLVWRLWRDRLESRALELQAEIQAAINMSLGGESMIAVRVSPGSREQSGTVELFVPAGWEDMLDPVWRVVLPLMPAGYTLVFRPSPGSARRAEPARRAA